MEMKEREVFRCDIKNLYFNMDCEEDPVCKKLVAAVEEAKIRMYNQSNIAQFESVSTKKNSYYQKCQQNLYIDPQGQKT